MSSPQSIICKPTPWFLFRAILMLAMFGIFAVLFYKDGSSGYRKANETYYYYQAFDRAVKEFAEMSHAGTLTAEVWKRHAAKRTVDLPEDASLLPASLARPQPWPPILQDYEQVKLLQINSLWKEFSKARELSSTPPEHPYDARKIKEQWVVCWICTGLAGVAAFFLLRTLGRSIAVDEEGITPQNGKKIPFSDLHALDLRKWESKGLAFLDYDGAAGKGRIRIDGLTYGGFKKEQGEPAERLMQLLKARFTGEIIDYAAVDVVKPSVESTESKS